MMSERRHRAYRWMTMVLPRSLRERRGAEMERAFGVLHEEARAAGRVAVLRLYALELADLLRVGMTLRLGAWRDRGRDRRSSALADETRLAARSVTRHRSFFLMAAGTFALGVAATTVTFSTLKSVVLDGLPYPDSDRLVIPWRTVAGAGTRLSPQSAETEAVLQDRSVFEDAATFSSSEKLMTSAGGVGPAKVGAEMMGPHLAALLGIRPVLGRLFTEDEHSGDGAHVLLLSHAVWRGQYGGSPDVLGATVTLDGEPWTVIGVMPPGLARPNGIPTPVDLWVPLPATAAFAQVIARLRPGVTVAAASEFFDGVVRRLSTAGNYGGTVLEATSMRSTRLRDPLRVLMIAVTMLLLIACVNVSNLLLHRASTRNRETAVLAALGASRPSLVRQFMMESVLLALAGGTAGTVLAAIGVRAIIAFRPAELDVLQVVRVDGGVLAFALAVSTAAGILFGLVPAFRAARVDAAETLTRAQREGDNVPARLRWGLVATEVALSFALLAGASMVIGTLRDYMARDPGFDPDGLVDIDITLPGWTYMGSSPRRATFDRIVERVDQVPGVTGVSLSHGVPPRMGLYFGQVHVEGKAPQPDASRFHGAGIDAHYLDVIGQRLVAGRTFNDGELAGDVDAVILGETAAGQLFPGEDAIGRRFSIGGDNMFTVVGIVRDAALVGLSTGTTIPIAYWPLTEVYATSHVLVRLREDDADIAATLREAVRSIEPEALINITPATKLLGDTLARERFTTSLLGGFALFALMLAAIGLYSVLSSVVSRRTHEIGIRVSLGADASSIRRLVLRSGLAAVGVGIAAGVLLLLSGRRVLESQVFGLGRNDPMAWIGAAVLLLVISLIALWIPVERAARTDPMRAMRIDG